ncbi:MAG TPA: DUF3293 domain-containing protein [Oleiagrimonas sp.]|nr:DUF3293 domain-containing protein [Oleiagrimonas sp.]
MPTSRGELTALYERTQYRVRLGLGGCAVIRIHQPLPASLQALLPNPQAAWAFITAWNPLSQRQPADINRLRQRRLLARLRQLEPVPRIAAGVGVGSVDAHGQRWREASLFAAGIAMASVDELMREFQQHAVVCGHGHEPAELRFNPQGVHCPP